MKLGELLNMTNDDPSRQNGQQPNQPQKPRLKTLGDLFPRLTPEQLKEFEAKEKKAAEARKAARYKWSDAEVIRFIDAFKAQKPEQYAAYIEQEVTMGWIKEEPWLEMGRLIDSVFPDLAALSYNDKTGLLGLVRRHVRNQLKLR